jgi:hypothetical protein
VAIAGKRNSLWRAFFKLVQARLRPQVRTLCGRELCGKGQRSHGQRRVAEDKTGAAKMLGEKIHLPLSLLKSAEFPQITGSDDQGLLLPDLP